MKKPVILIPVRYYFPAVNAGGPVRSLVGLVEHLSNDFQIKIITPNHDLGNTTSFDSTIPDQWQKTGNAEVFYLSEKMCYSRYVRQLIKKTPYDILYLNSFFDPLFTIKPLWWRCWGLIPNKPVVLAPRGELSENAISLKVLKKKYYARFSKIFSMTKNIFWQASAPLERYAIESFLKKYGCEKNPVIQIARDLRPMLPRDTNRPVKKKGEIQLIFLSRLHPIKQLHVAIEVLRFLQGKVCFDIFGTYTQQEKNYIAMCQNIVTKLPDNIHVTFCGDVNPWEVGNIMAAHHVFVLPTLTENYGHVIGEALSAGCPVVISDQTPWQNLKEHGVGNVVPLEDINGYAQAIQKYIDMDEREFAEISRKAHEYGEAERCNPDVIEDNKRLFMEVLKQYH
ncbi:MAG: glycosyltransferase family 4 protein [Planctomycetaceae bacterium]|jgi:glycosyltransferase involved in cell wall biosynthesis|nr:glycosyltransferase family 4 protein [Planctomycetaceae bacterium]